MRYIIIINCFLSGANEFIICLYWDSCCSVFSFLCNILRFIVWSISFSLTIVLSDLQYTASDYPFAIFKLLCMKILKRPAIDSYFRRDCLTQRKMQNQVIFQNPSCFPYVVTQTPYTTFVNCLRYVGGNVFVDKFSCFLH